MGMLGVFLYFFPSLGGFFPSLVAAWLLGAPAIDLHWTERSESAIQISVVGQDDFIERCARSGLEVRYRYRLMLCKARSYWFDGCQDARIIKASFRYDPISETYAVAIDQHRDADAPRTLTVTSLDQAFAAISNIAEVKLATLGAEEQLDRSRAYLALQLLGNCKSGYSETFARISNVLSLGLVGAGVYDSGWMHFSLDGQPR